MNSYTPKSQIASSRKPTYKPYSKGQFNPRKYETPGFSINQIIQVKEAFDFFDKDRSGSLQMKELKEAMQMLGFIQDDEDDITNLIKIMDENGDQNLDFQEFMEIISANIAKNDSNSDLQAVFQHFIDLGNSKFLVDDDEEGEVEQSIKKNGKKNLAGNSNKKITIQMLRNVAKQIGEDIDDEDIIDMLDKADKDDDGEIGFADFKTIIQWKNPELLLQQMEKQKQKQQQQQQQQQQF